MTLQIDKLSLQIAKRNKVSLLMARADLLHPLASGNKLFKLSPNLKAAKDKGYSEVLSFGGAFSNHIHALALMAKKQNLKSIGIIRGEKEYASNPTLRDAQKAGMQLIFVTRKDYKRRDDSGYLYELQQQFPNAFFIPEGGSSQLAVDGCAQLAEDIDALFIGDVLTIPSGTGATLAGLICGTRHKQVRGYAVLADQSLATRVEGFIDHFNGQHNRIKANYVIEKSDFGGYAKLDSAVLDFIFDWLDQTGILLDPIYTSKMCMRLMQQIQAGEFKAGTTITIVHSGGLQGWRGMKERVIKMAGNEKWNALEKHL